MTKDKKWPKLKLFSHHLFNALPPPLTLLIHCSFVSKSEAGPIIPSPVRAMMKFERVSPVVQRMMSSMMSWLMHEEDTKVQAGQVLKEINKVGGF